MHKHIFKAFYLLTMMSFLMAPNNNVFAKDSEGGHEQWEYVLEGSGDVLQLAIPLSALAYTLYDEDYESAKELALTYGATTLITYSLKYLVHRKRPEGRKRYDSFPSGHTSSAFSGAAFIQKKYGWQAGIYAYVLAAIVGVSRTEGPDGYHDFWDVLGGAAVGIGNAYYFTHSKDESKVALGFSSSKDSKGLMLSVRF